MEGERPPPSAAVVDGARFPAPRWPPPTWGLQKEEGGGGRGGGGGGPSPITDGCHGDQIVPGWEGTDEWLGPCKAA